MNQHNKCPNAFRFPQPADVAIDTLGLIQKFQSRDAARCDDGRCLFQDGPDKRNANAFDLFDDEWRQHRFPRSLVNDIGRDGRIARTTIRGLQKRTGGMVAAVQQTKEFVFAFVEFVVARGADEVALGMQSAVSSVFSGVLIVSASPVTTVLPAILIAAMSVGEEIQEPD